MSDISPSAQRVQEALAARGLDTRVVELPGSTRTAEEAARAIGCTVAQIAKSLVFRRRDTGAAVLVIASGAHRVDEAQLARHVGAEIERAKPELVRSATGYAIGGVPPVGHASALETWVDNDLLDLEILWAAAGTPHAVFPITPQQLVEATGGRVVALALEDG